MKYWPVPNNYSKNIPAAGTPGSFWEDRGDRWHCGIDIYAPKGSDVVTIEGGKVTDIGLFTSSSQTPYWNTTYFVFIQNIEGKMCKYAELQDATVRIDEQVHPGQLIGHIGQVVNSKRVPDKSPVYIQKLVKKKRFTMLHFELYKGTPPLSKKYLGGNWYGSKKPIYLANPTFYLLAITRN